MSERLLQIVDRYRNPDIPNHVALMPDGTRRSSRKKNVSFYEGYQRGAERIRDIVEYVLAHEKGKTLSFGLVSDDNLSRPLEHITPIFDVLEEAVGFDGLIRRGVRIQVMGDIHREGIPQRVQKRFADLTDLSKDNKNLFLNLAIGYDGLEDAAAAAAKLASAGVIIDKESLGQQVAAGRPPVDLFIRTGKETRLGGFMPLETEFAELYFADVYWPDFSVKQFKRALRQYGNRERRYGK